MENKELKLIIDSDIKILLEGFRNKFYINKSYFSNQENIPIHELDHNNKKLFENYETLNIYVNKNNFEEKVVLPTELKSNLLNFIKNFKTNKKYYCCINFVYELMYGREQIFRDNFLYGMQLSYFDIKKIQRNDVIIMYDYYKDNDINKMHVAIHLDKEYFISLIGTNGPLTITSLEELTKLYDMHKIKKFYKVNINIINIIFGISNIKNYFTYSINYIFKYCYKTFKKFKNGLFSYCSKLFLI